MTDFWNACQMRIDGEQLFSHFEDAREMRFYGEQLLFKPKRSQFSSILTEVGNSSFYNNNRKKCRKWGQPFRDTPNRGAITFCSGLPSLCDEYAQCSIAEQLGQKRPFLVKFHNYYLIPNCSPPQSGRC